MIIFKNINIMITQEEIRQIILNNLEIGSLPLDIQDKILEKLGANIIKKLTLTILKNLPEEVIPEFEKLSDSGDEIKLQEFLKSRIPNLEILIRETIKATIDEYKEIIGK